MDALLLLEIQLLNRQRGVDHELNSRPDHQLDLFTVIPLAALVLTVEILNVLSLFEWFVSLALKRHQWGGTN